MFHGPSFIVCTMQEETTPIFKRLWYDWTQQQPGIGPTNPLGQCWVPPIVTFYDQQRLLRNYSLPGGSIRSPHPGSPAKFATQFEETRRECLASIIEGWDKLDQSEKDGLSKIDNFYCGLHVLGNASTSAEQTICLWEKEHDVL